MSKKYFSIAVLILLSFFFAFENPHNKPSLHAQEKRVISNPEKGLWEREFRKKITIISGLNLGVDEGPENQIFFRPHAVAVDKQGNIFVVDSGNNRIQKFNKDIKFLITLGRKGKGPGEFMEPQDISFDKNDNVYVADYGNRRIQIFSNNGYYLGGFNTVIQPINISVNLNDAIYVVADLFFGAGKYAIFKYDAKGNLIKSFIKILKNRDVILQAALNRMVICTDEMNNFYVAYAYGKYRIQKFDANENLILEFNRTLPFKTYYPVVERKKNPDGETWSTMISDLTPPTVISLASDKQGHIFILLFNGATRTFSIDIFDTEGNFLTNLKLDIPSVFKIYVDSQMNLYLVDLSDSMKIYRYHLQIEE